MKYLYHFIKKPGLIAGILFAAILPLQSQTTNVTVSSNQFSPADITINVGDQVTWTNVGGFHNVNGTQDAYPNNPESFGNSVGSGWEFSHTFNTPGFYNYHCDPHQSFGMTGTVTVNETTGIFNNNTETIEIKSYPNPAQDILYFEVNEFKEGELNIEVYNIYGNLVETKNTKHKAINSLKIETLTKGFYLLQIQAGDLVYQASFIKN